LKFKKLDRQVQTEQMELTENVDQREREYHRGDPLGSF
jgi:hypothetical protein